MMERMSLTNKPPDLNTFKEIARLKRIREGFIEKDWYVTQVIRVMAGISYDAFPLIFTGGTALSKAHHLIQRFSEDIDFRVNAHPDTHSRGARSRFKNAVLEGLQAAGFENNQVYASNENRFFSIAIDYESGFPPSPMLRPHIQLDVFIEEVQLLPVQLPVSSFVNELSKQPPEVPAINCIHQVESAADKLSAIVWRIPDRRRGTDNDDPTIVRHIHDLAMLKDGAVAHPDFAKLTTAAVQRDSARPKNLSSFGDIPLAEKFNIMLSILDQDAEYPGEYDNFIETMSYLREAAPPDFAAGVKAIRELVKIVGG
jgi:Nucleotidyl transferase AbiEii toxin, Type IV TA system